MLSVRVYFLFMGCLAALTVSGTAGCAGKPSGGHDLPFLIRITGSDTMHALVQKWAETYMRVDPNVSIYTEGGGSGSGIEALINGKTDLCAASRTMTAEEVRKLLDRQGSLGMSVLTARDALSVYVHPDNPVRDLTMNQLRGIFSGKIRFWKEVGGRDEPIFIVNRSPNSGTYLFFQQHVLLDTPYVSEALTAPTTIGVVREVSLRPAAIGYGGMAYGEAVIHCRINGIPPTADTVRSGAYPLARYLYLYTAQPPRGKIRAFVDWILSDAGQRVAQSVGFIPLWNVESP